jgi:PAS domain S-box-containing protein
MMTLRTQLLLLVLVPLLCIGGALWGLLELRQTSDLAGRGTESSARLSGELNDFILFLQEPPPGKTAHYQLQATRNRVDNLSKPVPALFGDPDELQLLEQLATAPELLGRQVEQIRRSGAATLTSRQAAQLTQELRRLLQASQGLTTFYNHLLLKAHQHNSRLNLLLLLMALAWPLCCALLLQRTLVRPVRQLREGLNALTKGQLGLRLSGSPPGELGQLYSAFNTMVETRQRVEEQAREAEVRLKGLLEDLQMLTVSLDQNGAISYCNEYLLEVTGRKRHEVIGKNWFELFVPEPEPARQLFAQLMQNNQIDRHCESELLTKDGSCRLVAWNTILNRDTSGAITGATGIGSDITEKLLAECNLKRSNAELRQSNEELQNQVAAHAEQLAALNNSLQETKQRTEGAETAQGAFLANMSHALRTPMNAILGLTRLTLQTDLNAKQHEYLHSINGSAHHLLGVINDMLDFFTIESGNLKMAQTAFRLGEVLDRIMGSAKTLAKEKGLTLTAVIAEGVPDSLQGDPLRLEQILFNLLSNAVEFTEQGQITLRIACGQASDDPGKIRLQFTVQDSGIGMDQETLAQLYRPFSQADNSTTRLHGGTGLGLSLCKRLAELMGGAITVQSSPGNGSTFTFSALFELGARQPRTAGRAVQTPVPQRQQSLRGSRLLVAEGQQINLQISRELLEYAGASVETAHNGEEALKLATDHGDCLDAILMDIRMPVMDGCEATRRIREHFPITQLPIFAMTDHGFDEKLQRCLAAGMNGHLPRPLDSKTLLTLLERHNGPGSGGLLDDTALPASLPGIDLEALLERVNHNRQLLVRLIRLFAHEQHAMAHEINQLIQEADLATAARLAHGLEGVAGNLAALELQRCAAQLEAALKQGDRDGASRLLAPFEQALLQVCGAAEQLNSITLSSDSDDDETTSDSLAGPAEDRSRACIWPTTADRHA